jgi:DNA-binding NtrC family response regulator
MPGEMNGLDLAYAVRKAFPMVPIVLITGYAHTETSYPPGDFEVVEKPFKLDAILAAVRKAIGLPKAQAVSS